MKELLDESKLSLIEPLDREVYRRLTKDLELDTAPDLASMVGLVKIVTVLADRIATLPQEEFDDFDTYDRVLDQTLTILVENTQ